MAVVQNAITFTAYATENGCYKAARAMPNGVPMGIVVHSTGANNPNLKRYVNCAEICGENANKNYFDTATSTVCPHAVIGKDKDGVVRAAKLLPWTVCCWGCGSGSRGSYNYSPAYIQFEICEDDLTDEAYFTSAFTLAAQLCARLMKNYPTITIENVISHKEAHDRGYASNHGDPDHWLSKFGHDMDWFRELVQSAAAGTETAEISAAAAQTGKLYRVQIGAFSVKQNAENYLAEAKKKGLDGFVIASTDKLYRVQIGAFSVKANAENYLAQAIAAGFDGFVLEVDG